jgi:hypothetical protein
MGEYGRVVGQSSGVGGGGGSGDVTGQIMNALGDAVDAVASQPPEILAGIAVVLLILLVIFFRR